MFIALFRTFSAMYLWLSIFKRIFAAFEQTLTLRKTHPIAIFNVNDEDY